MARLLKRIVSLAFWTVCASTSFGQSGLFTATDTAAELDAGRFAYEQVLKSGILSKNEAYVRRTERIFSQLVEALPYKTYPFRVVVIADNEVNAGCLPGGFMVVNEGLLTKMPDDNELAFTLGHEIGHAIRRHWSRKISHVQRDVLIHTVLSVLTNSDQSDQEGIFLRSQGYSRDMETEADLFGTELYLRAGFEESKVSAGMREFEKIEAQERQEAGSKNARMPEYLISHPYTEKRIANIEKRARELVVNGLKPINVSTPDITVEKVFGKIPTIATQDCEWQPLKAGMTWDYDIMAPSSRSHYSIKAVGVTTISGSTVARMSMSLGEKEINYQVIADIDRVWRRNRLEDQDSPWDPEVIFPIPESSLEGGKKVFANAGTETVETPAGKFEGCIKIVSTDALGRVLTHWYAKGVGLVKRTNEKSGVTEVLTKFYSN